MNPRILLVDDVKMFLEIQENLLKPLAVKTATARDGEQALRLVEEFGPDLVVLDANMPLLDGVTCCRTLKRDPRYSRIPVILTVSNSSASVDHCRSAGCDALLRKPLDPGAFIDTITTFIPDIERRDRRVGLLAPVAIKSGGRSFSGAILNISRSGAFLEPDEPLPVGAQLELTLALPSLNKGPLQLRAQVVRLSLPDARGMHSGVGVAFIAGDGHFQKVSRSSPLAAYLQLRTRKTGVDF